MPVEIVENICGDIQSYLQKITAFELPTLAALLQSEI